VSARLITGIAGITVAVGLAGCSAVGTPMHTASPPKPSDFRLDVIVTGKDCPAPPSCVYTYDVHVTGYPKVAAPLDPAMTVIYTVTGADEPMTAHFVVNKDGTVWNPGTANVAIGPQNTTFVATVPRVIEED
jgi:hypothetical protein